MSCIGMNVEYPNAHVLSIYVFSFIDEVHRALHKNFTTFCSAIGPDGPN